MLSDKLLAELRDYVARHLEELKFAILEAPSRLSTAKKRLESREIDDFINTRRRPSFSQVLLDIIDKKGATDVEIYKKAGLDRRHFSKIRSNPDYRPRKTTVVALALALELDKKETDTLLAAAGYSLSESDTFDLVIQFCLLKGIYNIQDVNEALDYFSLNPLMGALE